MIPILHDQTETQFQNQGIGPLSSALSCIVTEERNGQYELAMEYPVDGQHWRYVHLECIILAKPSDGSDPQPFRIYRISKPLKGICRIYASHISYQLSHIPVMPFSAQSFSDALNGLVQNSAETCPFNVWTDVQKSGGFTVATPASFRSLLGGSSGSLLDTYGSAEYEFDRWTVKAHTRRGADRGVTISFGKNLTNISQDETDAGAITGICPFWKGQDAPCITLPERVILLENGASYPYQRIVPVDFTSEFSSSPSTASLRAAAERYLENHDGSPTISIDVSFIPLWQSPEYADKASVERVRLCDTVTVIHQRLGIAAKAKVVKTEYDVLRERYRKIEIGNVHKSLEKTLADNTAAVEKSVAAIMAGASSQTGASHVLYGVLRVGTASNYVPSSSTIPLSNGDFRIQSGFVYICVDSQREEWRNFSGSVDDYLVDPYTGSTHRWTGLTWEKVTDYKTALADFDSGLNRGEILNRLTGQTTGWNGSMTVDGFIYTFVNGILTGRTTA